MSYLHDLYFDCFQTTKRHSYNSCSIHKPIFSSFHAAVYPVDVTTNRSCVTRIIGHKSLTVHRICTKCDTRIRLWTPFLCAKFQGDQSTCLRFIAIFASVRKEEKKTKKKKRRKNRNFGCWYLRNGLSDFLQIWNVDSPSWRATLQQMWLQSDKGSPRYKGVKMTFSFFLLIYPRCGTLASCAARHTIVCLDTVYTSLCHYHTNDVLALSYWWPLVTMPLLCCICHYCDILS